MNIIKEQIDDLNAVLRIEVSKDDYMSKVDEALKKYKKQVNMKGFRQGMVPDSLVRKMYGNSILYEEINKLVSQQINTYIKESKLDILGQPLPKSDYQISLDIKKPEDLILEYDLGLVPGFDLSALKSGSFLRYDIQVDDALLEEEIEGLRTRNGVQKYVVEGIVEEKDVLHVDIVELENGEIKEGGVTNSTSLNLNIFKKDIIDRFLGLRIGQHVDLNLLEAADRDRNSILKFLLDLKEDVPTDLGDSFRITITKIGKMEKADLDDAFFAQLYGEGVVNNIEELKTKLTDEVSAYFSKETEVKLKNEIIQYLLDNVTMEFPTAFLKRWIKATNEKPISDQQVESDFENFVKGLRWSLITNKLSAENDIKADRQEVEKFSAEQLKLQLQMYNSQGLTINDEDLKSFNATMMAKEEHVKKTYETLMEQKLFDFIKNEVTIKDRPISLDEFRNLNQV